MLLRSSTSRPSLTRYSYAGLEHSSTALGALTIVLIASAVLLRIRQWRRRAGPRGQPAYRAGAIDS